MTHAVGREGGDTIFAIDRHVEPVIERAIEGWPSACKPLVLIAEGMGDDGVKRWGDPSEGEPKFKVIVDPIDGTRGLMYDKRAAWFIAAVCPGDATSVADAITSVIVELPTSKAGYADTFMATRKGTTMTRVPLYGDNPLRVQSPGFAPSTATTLLHGFGHVVGYFPRIKSLAAELMQRIADATIDPADDDGAAIFDDQYISTAGQFVELMTGRDRFCADLRPLFDRILGGTGAMACHPYDTAGMLAAQGAGVILTDGFGHVLRPPLDVHTGVHWCGYANERIREQIEPVILGFLADHGLHGP